MKKIKWFYPVLGLAMFLVTTSMASARWGVSHGDVDISIISDRRGELQQYPVEPFIKNTERAYVGVKKREQYSVQVRNNTGKRVGVVIAIDGRNIISGEKSYLDRSERMYILDPWQTSTFEGWRTGKNRVNRFFFTKAPKSYAASWGDKSAMGVIAAAVFEEKKRRVKQYNDYENRSKSSRSARGKELGTGYGRTEYSPSYEVRFKAKKRPMKTVFIKYEGRKRLCKKGIIECDNQRPQRPYNRFWPETHYALPPGLDQHEYDYYRY